MGARRLGALIAFKDSPFGRVSRSMRAEEETSSERRPDAPQPCPLHRPAGWQTALPTSSAGTANQGRACCCFCTGIQSTLHRYRLGKKSVSPSAAGQLLLPVKANCKSPGLYTPWKLTVFSTGSGNRDCPPSFIGVRISHSQYNYVTLVCKVRSLETSHKNANKDETKKCVVPLNPSLPASLIPPAPSHFPSSPHSPLPPEASPPPPHDLGAQPNAAACM